MAKEIRQSTSIDVPIGPFTDTSAVAQTALTITQPDIRLKKNGNNWAQKAAAQTLTHEENGYYELTLDATDTNTLGLLRVNVAKSGTLQVFDDYLVITAEMWDYKYAGTDFLTVDVRQFNGTNGTFALGRPEVNTTHIAGTTVATGTAQLGVNVVNIGGSAASQTGGLLNANMSQISGDATAADNLETFLDGTGGSNFTGTWVGNLTGNLSGSVGSLGTGAITSATLATGAITSSTLAAGTITAASIASAALTNAKFGTGALAATNLASDVFTTTASGVWGASTSGYATGTFGYEIGPHIGLHIVTTSGGTVTTVVLNSSTGVDGSVPSAVDDFYNGCLLSFTSGALNGQRSVVTDYVGSTKTLTVVGLTSAPAAGVTGVLS